MKKALLGVCAAMCLLLSSCAFSNNLTSNANELQTQVVLQKKNYKVIGTVSGESSQMYIIGIGGNLSVRESAMNKMFENANLTGSQAIINANVRTSVQTFLGLYTKKRAVATGTIIEFTD